MTTRERVVKVIQEQLGVRKEDIKPESNVSHDLGADSLDGVELIMGLEEEFGVGFPDEEINERWPNIDEATVEQIVAAVEGKVNPKAKPETTMEQPIKDLCNALRRETKLVGDAVKALMKHPHFQQEQKAADEHGEMKANIMLAYRHLEDARMRLGKVIQAHDGGVSSFDK